MSMKKQENVLRQKACVSVKVIALFLCCIVLLTSCGGNSVNTDDAQTTVPEVKAVSYELKAPYSASDSLNPFFCTTSVNASAASLMYDSLFNLTDDMSVTPVLASSFSEAENTLRVVLKNDGSFSDSSAIKAEDVVYSFNMAKESSNYADSLECITEAKAVSPIEVVFTVNGKIGNTVNLLTFPIVKNGSADGRDTVPVGSSDYIYEKSGDNPILKRRTEKGQVSQITLVPVTDSEKLMYMLRTGEIDFYCSDLYGSAISRSNAKLYSVAQNNLVFMGINSGSYLLGFENIRKAVFNAVGRTEIADSVYSRNAAAACYPFRADSAIIKKSGVDTVAVDSDYKNAEQLLIEEGFVTVEPGSGIRSGDKGTLNLTLIVNSESAYRVEAASCIKDSLAKAGIGITVKTLAYEEYLNALESGSYDMYLGEVKLPANGSLTCFFGGKVSYGIARESSVFLGYNELYQGTASLSAFLTSFVNEVPFIPLCFRNDVLVCNERITADNSSFVFAQALKNITEWKISDKKSSLSEAGTTGTTE